RAQCQSDLDVALRNPVVDVEHLGKKPDGEVAPTGLLGEEAEQIKGADMFRVRSEDIATGALGLGQAPATVMFERGCVGEGQERICRKRGSRLTTALPELFRRSTFFAIHGRQL